MRKGVAGVSMVMMMPVVPSRRGTEDVRRSATLALLAGCGLLAAGCSSAGHDQDYAQRLNAYANATQFAPLQAEATNAAAGRLAIRLPKEFRDQIDDRDKGTPPFLRDFPGFVAAYQVQRPVGTTQYPVSLVVGTVPAAERRREDVKQVILEQVRRDESFRKAAWGKPRQVEDVTGQPRTWDVLTLEGEQPFELIDTGSPVEKRRPGVTEIWVSADPKQKACVVLAWRVPDEVAAAVSLATLAPLTARTVSIAD